jgi:hypothetical protein
MEKVIQLAPGKSADLRAVSRRRFECRLNPSVARRSAAGGGQER